MTPEHRAALLELCKALERENAQLRQLLDEIHRGEATVEACEWAITDEGSWLSTCGHEWVFEDGTPTEHGVRFCHSCGKPMTELPAKWDEWGDPIIDAAQEREDA